MIQGIIDIRETDKKRPDRETIPVYVTKKTGVDAEEVYGVISSLMGSGCILQRRPKVKNHFSIIHHLSSF